MSHTIKRIQNRHTIHWVFDENYRLFFRLFSEESLSNDYLELMDDYGEVMVEFRVSERFRYTVDVEITRPLALLKQLPDLVINFRLYFDAQALEVTGFQGIQKIQPRIDYAPEKGHSLDDKLQVNLLLHELLHLCLRKRYRSPQSHPLMVMG